MGKIVPSLLHEGIIALVREKPELAAEFLQKLLSVSVPVYTEARLAETSLNDLVPTEYHADAVVLLVDGEPVFGIILEAQLQPDRNKRFAWPQYAVSARARYRCPFVVLVVTHDPVTARWAADSVDLGGGNVWAPFVVGPEGIPLITDVDRAIREPQLAVLSAMAHGRGDVDTALAVATTALKAISSLDDSMRVLYSLVIESSLGEAARKALEMRPETMQQFFSERDWTSFAAGEAKALLRVLARRGLDVPDEQRARILSCTDVPTLETWLDRAVTAVTVDEIFC